MVWILPAYLKIQGLISGIKPPVKFFPQGINETIAFKFYKLCLKVFFSNLQFQSRSNDDGPGIQRSHEIIASAFHLQGNGA